MQLRVAAANQIDLTINGLVVVGQPHFREWERTGEMLRVVERSCPFLVGDFLNLGEALLGESFAQIYDATNGWSEETCRNYRWIARQIPYEVRRMDKLTVAHHQLVAKLTVAQQRRFLTAAADQDWTVNRLREAIAQAPHTGLKPVYWVIVSAENEADQLKLMERMMLEGRSVKANTATRKRPKKVRKAS